MTATAFQVDPSRTAMERRALAAEMTRRFDALRKAVWALLIADSVLNANAGEWEFRTDPAKVESFRRWLQNQINLRILETRTDSGLPSAKKPWLAARIISAYQKGVARAYADARKRDPYAGPEVSRAKEIQHLEGVLAVNTSKVELLYTRAYEDLAGVTADMATKLARLLATGLINGDSPHSIARKMAGQIDGISLKRARAIARTEIVNAHAEGTLDSLELLGVKAVGALVEFRTAGDSKVCPKCKKLGGRRFTVAQARGRIPVHPNCVLPGTKITARGLVAAIRAFYRGNVFQVTTRSGATIAVTENHQFLTSDGFVSANTLRLGKYLIRSAVGDAVDVPDTDNCPALVEEIFHSPPVAGAVTSVSVPHSPKYLHGDGRFCDGNVDVKSSDRFLGHAFQTASGEHLQNLPLCAYGIGVPLDGLSVFESVLIRLSLAAHGVVSLPGELRPALGIGLPHSYKHSFTPISGSESGCFHSVPQGCATNANTLSGLLKGFSSLVACDEVVRIDEFFYENHVYDLQTVSGLYIGNNLLSSNCRCAWVPVK